VEPDTTRDLPARLPDAMLEAEVLSTLRTMLASAGLAADQPASLAAWGVFKDFARLPVTDVDAGGEGDLMLFETRRLRPGMPSPYAEAGIDREAVEVYFTRQLQRVGSPESSALTMSWLVDDLAALLELPNEKLWGAGGPSWGGSQTVGEHGNRPLSPAATWANDVDRTSALKSLQAAGHAPRLALLTHSDI
jgi:hypothetical protein